MRGETEDRKYKFEIK